MLPWLQRPKRGDFLRRFGTRRERVMSTAEHAHLWEALSPVMDCQELGF